MANLKVDVKGDRELVVYLNNISTSTRVSLMSALHEVGAHIRDKAKDKLGTYQTGWPKLKTATVLAKYRRRARLNGVLRPNLSRVINMINIGLGDDPLILSGKLRDSIEYEVNNAMLETVVYSDVEYAAVHEYGHGKVPARSYMRLTLWDEEDYIVKLINDRVKKLL